MKYFSPLQSPINIDAALAVSDVRLPPLRFSPAYKEAVQGKLENNGHTGEIENK